MVRQRTGLLRIIQNVECIFYGKLMMTLYLYKHSTPLYYNNFYIIFSYSICKSTNDVDANDATNTGNGYNTINSIQSITTTLPPTVYIVCCAVCYGSCVPFSSSSSSFFCSLRMWCHDFFSLHILREEQIIFFCFPEFQFNTHVQ